MAVNCVQPSLVHAATGFGFLVKPWPREQGYVQPTTVYYTVRIGYQQLHQGLMGYPLHGAHADYLQP